MFRLRKMPLPGDCYENRSINYAKYILKFPSAVMMTSHTSR